MTLTLLTLLALGGLGGLVLMGVSIHRHRTPYWIPPEPERSRIVPLPDAYDWAEDDA